jgi:hypothetical protein
MFGIQMYHEEMKVKLEYTCGPIIIGEVIVIGLKKFLESDSFCYFLSDGLMDSKYIWYTNVS